MPCMCGRGGLHTQLGATLPLSSLVVRRPLPGDTPSLLSLSPTPDLHKRSKNKGNIWVDIKTFFLFL